MVDWSDLVREHRAAVYGVAWRILGHAQDAEDVVQEVFAEVHRQPDGAPVVCWAALLRRTREPTEWFTVT
jgi:DNA-directed RNA polymerase specialized sigma24 family protein